MTYRIGVARHVSGAGWYCAVFRGDTEVYDAGPASWAIGAKGMARDWIARQVECAAMTLTAKSGTVYTVCGHLAYPVRDPDQRCRGSYNPRLDWSADAAAARGVLVDTSLDPQDYRVRAAGPEWREVYDAIRAMQPV